MGKELYENRCIRCGKITFDKYKKDYWGRDCVAQKNIETYFNMTSEERAKHNKRYKKNRSKRCHH